MHGPTVDSKPTRADRCRRGAAIAAIAVGLALPGATVAGPFPADLAIAAEIDLSSDSFGPAGSSSRQATATLGIAGATQTGSVDDTIVTNLPLSGTLAGTGDAIDLDLSVAGTGVDADVGLFMDSVLQIANTAAATIFDLVFSLSLDLAVETAGDDAAASAAAAVFDATGSGLIPLQGVTASSLVGPLDDNLTGTLPFTVTLAPGAAETIHFQADLDGINGLFGLAGAGDSFNGQLTARLSIDDVIARAVPTPPSAALLFCGALLLGLVRSRQIPRRY
jgi:hypothetical protein